MMTQICLFGVMTLVCSLLATPLPDAQRMQVNSEVFFNRVNQRPRRITEEAALPPHQQSQPTPGDSTRHRTRSRNSRPVGQTPVRNRLSHRRSFTNLNIASPDESFKLMQENINGNLGMEFHRLPEKSALENVLDVSTDSINNKVNNDDNLKLSHNKTGIIKTDVLGCCKEDLMNIIDDLGVDLHNKETPESTLTAKNVPLEVIDILNYDYDYINYIYDMDFLNYDALHLETPTSSTVDPILVLRNSENPISNNVNTLKTPVSDSSSTLSTTLSTTTETSSISSNLNMINIAKKEPETTTASFLNENRNKSIISTEATKIETQPSKPTEFVSSTKTMSPTVTSIPDIEDLLTSNKVNESKTTEIFASSEITINPNVTSIPSVKDLLTSNHAAKIEKFPSKATKLLVSSTPATSSNGISMPSDADVLKKQDISNTISGVIATVKSIVNETTNLNHSNGERPSTNPISRSKNNTKHRKIKVRKLSNISRARLRYRNARMLDNRVTANRLNPNPSREHAASNHSTDMTLPNGTLNNSATPISKDFPDNKLISKLKESTEQSRNNSLKNDGWSLESSVVVEIRVETPQHRHAKSFSGIPRRNIISSRKNRARSRINRPIYRPSVHKDNNRLREVLFLEVSATPRTIDLNSENVPRTRDDKSRPIHLVKNITTIEDLSSSLNNSSLSLSKALNEPPQSIENSNVASNPIFATTAHSMKTMDDDIVKNVTEASQKRNVTRVSSTRNSVPHFLRKQLGINPLGRQPGGVAPFGLSPQGYFPFGLAPSGLTTTVIPVNITIPPKPTQASILTNGTKLDIKPLINDSESYHTATKNLNNKISITVEQTTPSEYMTESRSVTADSESVVTDATQSSLSSISYTSTTKSSTSTTEASTSKTESNTSTTESTTSTTESSRQERYHVQVKKPDGSINGDYIVQDHNTGSLNGVRYEAVDGADQALIQKALLAFLSLDPRLDPRPRQTVK